MMHEKDCHEHAWFVTLTYDNEHLPKNGSLCPEHLRAFLKALRKSEGRLSYYAVGEYGDQASRPHYHAVLYGPELSDRFLLPGRGPHPVWDSPSLTSAWGRGLTEFGAVTMGSASYVGKYAHKKVIQEENENLYTRVDPDTGELVEVVPEFARMSRRPAIGKRWISRYWREVYAWDRVVIDGVETKPPRFYDKWMEQVHPDPDCACDEHRERLLEVKEERRVETPDKYKLEAQKRIHEARNSLYSQRMVF